MESERARGIVMLNMRMNKKRIKEFFVKNYSLIPDFFLKIVLPPRNIVIEPIAGCDLECVLCPADIIDRKKGKLSFENFKYIVDKIPGINQIGLYWMGESLLNRELFDMIEYAGSLGIRTVLNTNGTNVHRYVEKIVDSGLSKIAISLDGITQESIEKYRKGINIEDVLRGIVLLSMCRMGNKSKHPEIVVRTLVFEHNENEIDKIKRFLELHDIDELHLVSPIMGGWGGKEKADKIFKANGFERKYFDVDYCLSVNRLVITHDGFLCPCCNDVHANIPYGNIFEKSFKELYWENRKHRIAVSKRELEICDSCRESLNRLKIINLRAREEW